MTVSVPLIQEEALEDVIQREEAQGLRSLKSRCVAHLVPLDSSMVRTSNRLEVGPGREQTLGGGIFG